MQTIFMAEFKNISAENATPSEKILPQKKILDSLLKEFAPRMKEKEFAFETLEGVLANREEIIKLIEKFAPEWPVEKIAGIDRAILEIGIYEIVFNEEIPPIVAINEAVEIAKHFGDENSPKFINGVLSSVMKNNTKNDEGLQDS